MAPTTPDLLRVTITGPVVPSCVRPGFSRTWGVQLVTDMWSCHAATATLQVRRQSGSHGAPQHRSQQLDRLSPLAAAFECGAAGLQRLRDCRVWPDATHLAGRKPAASSWRVPLQCADRGCRPRSSVPTVTHWSHRCRRSVASSGASSAMVADRTDARTQSAAPHPRSAGRDIGHRQQHEVRDKGGAAYLLSP